MAREPATLAPKAAHVLTASQVQAANQIARVVFEDAPRYGLPNPRALTCALWCNAYGESRFNPLAIGDNGASLGLFQLNTVKGLGVDAIRYGYTREDLFRAVVNTTVVMWECSRAPQVRAALTHGTLHDAVWAIVQYVERPADVPGDVAKRSAFLPFLVGLAPETPCSTVG